MKLTKSTLRKLIKEEMSNILQEESRRMTPLERGEEKEYGERIAGAGRKAREGAKTPEDLQKELDAAIEKYNNASQTKTKLGADWQKGGPNRNQQRVDAQRAMKEAEADIARLRKALGKDQPAISAADGPKGEDEEALKGQLGPADRKCPEGQEQIGTNADGTPMCGPAQTQAAAPEAKPKPKRFAGMSVRYLEKRGYKWDPEKGTMMHPKKGDVRDVKKRWNRIKKAREEARKEKERKRTSRPDPTDKPDKRQPTQRALPMQEKVKKKGKLLTENEIKRFAELFNK